MIIYCTNCTPLWLLLEDRLQQLRVHMLLHCVMERGLTLQHKILDIHEIHEVLVQQKPCQSNPNVVCSMFFWFDFLCAFIWRYALVPMDNLQTSRDDSNIYEWRSAGGASFCSKQTLPALCQLVLSLKKWFRLPGFRGFPLLTYWFQASRHGKSSFTKVQVATWHPASVLLLNRQLQIHRMW